MKGHLMNTTAPQLIELDPNTLVLPLDGNIRTETQLDPDFLKSVANSGVLVPILVVPNDQGSYDVFDGQRRTLAAIAAGVSVTAIVTSLRDAASRIADQLIVNDKRTALTDSEHAHAYQQLSLFGLSATQISKRTSTPLARVGNAIKVANTPAAAKALDNYQITIDDALVFAEFDTDEEAIAELTETLNTSPARFAHTSQRLRDEATNRRDRQKVEDEIAALDMPWIPEEPERYDPKYRVLDLIYKTDKLSQRVPEETIRAEAAGDLVAFPWAPHNSWADGVYTRIPWTVGYALTNWESHGWHVPAPYVSESGNKGPLTQEQKDERALSRVNAKLWMPATTVRIAWVKTLLQRRSLPTDWATLPAIYYATFPSDYGSRIQQMAHELLEVTENETWPKNALPGYLEATSPRSPHVLLAIAAAGIESGLDEKKGWASTDPKLPLYLQILSSWGYNLSELEEALVKTVATAA